MAAFKAEINNAASQVTASITVSKASQTITGFNPPTTISQAVGSTLALSATGGASGNAVTFSTTTPSVCTVSGNSGNSSGTSGATLTVQASGSCSLTANQAGNDNYNAASPVTVTISITVPAQLYFIHADHLGTPRAITKASDNTKVWEWKNDDPFGNNTPDENPNGANTSAFKYNLRFPGQYFDEETNTHYNYFRDYDPSTGRYVQSDPIGLKGGINTYAYVDGAPISYKDYLGLLKWRGTLNIRGGGVGRAGAQKGVFELESECDIDGKKGIVTVEGYTGSLGFGWPVSETWGTVEFDEYRLRVDTELFNGRFRINSIGFQIGKIGWSGTRIFLGDAMSTNVDDYGLDIGVQVGVWGKAAVLKRKVVSCYCEAGSP